MAYQFYPEEALVEAAIRVHKEQLEKSLKDIKRAKADPDEALHEVRKRLKKLRGLLRLVRFMMPDQYRDLNIKYRDIGRVLSDLRDARAKLEALDKLEKRTRSETDATVFESVRSRLENDYRRQTKDGKAIMVGLKQTAADLTTMLDQGEHWNFTQPSAQTLMQGVEQTYRRARKAYQHCYQSSDATGADFHEWRKRTKYLWYEIQLVENCWPEPLKALRDQLKALASILGDEHDLTVIQTTLKDNIHQFEDTETLHPFIGVLQGWQIELRLAARQSGARLFAEKPKQFAGRLQTYWETCEIENQGDLRETATLRLVS
jgi:CHAD domain-containing protein